jgi:DNA-binding LacI/PurR family transcriptional regulator
MPLPSADRILFNRTLRSGIVVLSTNALGVTLTIALSSLTHGWLHTWMIWGALIFAILVLLIMFLVRLWRDSHIRYIAFVSSGTKGVSFYERFFQLIVEEAADHSRPPSAYTYVVFPWIANEGKARLQIGSLRRLNHSGIILIPDKNTDFDDDVNNHGVPIVLVDAVPGSPNRDLRRLHRVGGDEVSGGRLAASIATEWLISSQSALGQGLRSNPYIWILIGKKFDFMPKQRHEIFEQEIRKRFPGAVVMPSDELLYDYNRARTHIYDAVAGQRHSNQSNGLESPLLPDIIFCANDDMALGAREALYQLAEDDFSVTIRPRSESSEAIYPQIIGYDGMPNMRDLLRKQAERFLLGTVDVKLKDQVRNTWHALVNQLEGSDFPMTNIEMERIDRDWAGYPTNLSGL